MTSALQSARSWSPMCEYIYRYKSTCSLTSPHTYFSKRTSHSFCKQCASSFRPSYSPYCMTFMLTNCFQETSPRSCCAQTSAMRWTCVQKWRPLTQIVAYCALNCKRRPLWSLKETNQMHSDPEIINATVYHPATCYFAAYAYPHSSFVSHSLIKHSTTNCSTYGNIAGNDTGLFGSFYIIGGEESGAKYAVGDVLSLLPWKIMSMICFLKPKNGTNESQ